ncbi:hypothetical protein ACFS27_03340 [Promicromonospora vindobonensis]|uniref:SPP1 Gp6-like portal protein n=1 Tax=Promicromonospora vindobonensis TaxID=195748 RepID=A0ABW5VQC0_9MICO
MPLPTQDQAWPPPQLAHITPKLNEWAAWWTGNPADLSKAYHGTASPQVEDRPGQHRGGVVGALSRFWWGRPTNAGGQRRDDTHVPLAADIARASADLLFAEPLKVAVEQQAAQDRLDAVLTGDVLSTLTSAAEKTAALGGVYLKTVFDTEVAESAFLATEPADRAIPEFVHGRLRAVTFWRVLYTDDRQVWRHLERHELLAGDGVVQHSLYVGTPARLGRPFPLEAHPETAPLAGSVNDQGYITAGITKGLDVVYIPNKGDGEAKAWRKVPSAAGWGASDYDGAEPFLDDLDQQYASWMRDIRLGKARIIVAKYMLDDLGPGLGAGFDLDRDVYAPLKLAGTEDGDPPITPQQFAIRFAEHQATIDQWTDQIIGTAGYSPSTFGRDADGAAVTATEVVARGDRSTLTRNRNIRGWTPKLQQILPKLLTVDASVFGGTVDPTGLTVEFPDGVNESPETVARTAQALKMAGAASTRALVEMVHTDWDDTKVEEEVARIIAESPTALADPFSFGG